MMKEKLRIGCGAGFSGDRLEPALVLTEHGKLNYLVLECLAERTIALAQKRKLSDPTLGFDLLLERRMEGLIPLLVENDTRLITNMGAANPLAGGQRIIEISRRLGYKLKVAVVLGDDVFELITGKELSLEDKNPLHSYGRLVSANAYLGVEAILPALETDAQIIITGRVADPSLFLAPMIHEFGWALDDFHRLGQGTVLGHLLECAGQITGGYFADPVAKPIPDMHKLGHPFVDVLPDGTGILGKVPGTGGKITLQTVKEQLLYEVLDPKAYFTPDVIADFSGVKLTVLEENRIKVTGGTGDSKPQTFKVSVGYEGGFIGEGEISYAGAHALERAKLAGEIIDLRIGNSYSDFQVSYIGVNSLHGQVSNFDQVPYEVRLRIAGRATMRLSAQIIGEEVEALYTNGPAGGGGARKYVKEVVGVVSILLALDQSRNSISLLES